MLSDKKTDKILFNIYEQLYQAATPKASFKKLFDNAAINDLGHKIIPYQDYTIEESKAEKIIKAVLKNEKLPKYLKTAIRTTVLLGVSPIYKISKDG
jgi:endonuclease V-like protein UPF0215 family